MKRRCDAIERGKYVVEPNWGLLSLRARYKIGKASVLMVGKRESHIDNFGAPSGRAEKTACPQINAGRT